MRALKALVMMQIKDKIDMSFLSSWKKALFKTILFILKFAVITFVIYFAMGLLSRFRLLSILPGVPENFLVVIITFMLLLSLIVCTVGMSKTLYFSRDNQFLLTLPANRTVVFISKLIVYYVYELIRNITFFLPIFVAYGMINSMPFYYYIWMILGVAILTAFPVVFGALLSIPMKYVMGFLMQNKWLAYSLLVIVAGGFVALIVWIVYMVPTNFDIMATWGTTFWKIQDFLNTFNRIFIPFAWLTTLVAGTRYGLSNILFDSKQVIIIFASIGVILVVATITFFIVRPLYFKMASSPFEYKRKQVLPKENKRTGSLASVLKKEFLLLFRTPGKMFSLLAVAIFLPIAIFLLNKFYAAMDTDLLGGYMVLTFNILVVLLVVTATNSGIAHIFSEEGASSYLIKTSPQSHLKQLSMKLVINFCLMTISIVATTIIISSFLGYGFKISLMMFLTIEVIYIAHLLWSAEMDIMNPQNGQYQTTGQHVNNPNDLKSTLTSMVLSVVFAALTFFFMREGVQMVFTRLFVFAIIFLAVRVWLYVNKIKVYYEEKQG